MHCLSNKRSPYGRVITSQESSSTRRRIICLVTLHDSRTCYTGLSLARVKVTSLLAVHSAVMTPLSFAVLALAAVLFAPAVTAQVNCTAAAIKCFQNSNCTQKFNEYNMACAGAYASGQSVNCTSQCNTSLAAAIQLEPALGTCVCTDYTCSIGQRNLVKACYGM